MYVVLLTYTAPLEEVDYALPDHYAWLDRQFEAGNFLVSGRREPRTGGVIITRPMTRDHVITIMETDPFVLRKLVHYEVIEFQATRTVPELNACNEALARP
ncbi:uncharacterized protein YciI [Herbihabitans rhizosphaerae]|uniref:Uncharacterized protein YciI n=1 Tax=Herbihabitans rhizosphaerae TaxID=1872711 RepID=A0A4Q7L530_9PSEU|nr:YciI family protein [Herbihabitans rhizosphaerae]RZS44364.1 uncharacterized protein YciI [Herbihabitans rhizosphaerae]